MPSSERLSIICAVHVKQDEIIHKNPWPQYARDLSIFTISHHLFCTYTQNFHFTTVYSVQNHALALLPRLKISLKCRLAKFNLLEVSFVQIQIWEVARQATSFQWVLQSFAHVMFCSCSRCHRFQKSRNNLSLSCEFLNQTHALVMCKGQLSQPLISIINTCIVIHLNLNIDYGLP